MERAVVDTLEGMRGAGESYSDVILRMANGRQGVPDMVNCVAWWLWITGTEAH